MEAKSKQTTPIPAEAKPDVKLIILGDSAVGKSKYNPFLYELY